MAPPTLLLRTTSVVCLLGSLAIAGEVRRVPPAATTAAPDLASHEGEDWGGFLGPTGDGRSSLTTMAVPWPDGGPRIAWHVEMGEGYCAPAVARKGGKNCRIRVSQRTAGWTVTSPSHARVARHPSFVMHGTGNLKRRGKLVLAGLSKRPHFRAFAGVRLAPFGGRA